MRSVNPNVSEEEEISDSASVVFQIFFLLLYTFGLLDALLTASWRKDLSGDKKKKEGEGMVEGDIS